MVSTIRQKSFTFIAVRALYVMVELIRFHFEDSQIEQVGNYQSGSFMIISQKDNHFGFEASY